MDREQLAKALEHAFNYHSLDAELNTPDFELAELIVDEVQKYLNGTTDVQEYERIRQREA